MKSSYWLPEKNYGRKRPNFFPSGGGGGGGGRLGCSPPPPPPSCAPMPKPIVVKSSLLFPKFGEHKIIFIVRFKTFLQAIKFLIIRQRFLNK